MSKDVAFLISRLRWQMHKLLENQLAVNNLRELIVSQSSILTVLYDNDGKLTMSQIADLTRRDKSTVTYLVNKLIQQGYVIKEKRSEDIRITYVRLTSKGWGLHSIFENISEKLSDKIYGSLTKEEVSELKRLLEKILKTF